jgi:hypothetical protein
MDKTYFANLPKQDIAKDLYDKVQTYYEEIDRNGRLALWRKAHRYYFALNEAGGHEASGIEQGGEQGELSLLKANHYRNLLTHLHVLVTQNRPAFECRAINTDHESQVQTILGRNILEYYVREQRLDQNYRLAAEYALVYGEGYIEEEWDKAAGDPVAGDIDEMGELTGATLTTGDVVTRVYAPLDVVRPNRTPASGKSNWRTLRRWESRHDLAAEHPEFADAILAHSDDTPEDRLFQYGYERVQGEDEELIPVYVFYHDKTKACPTGRRVKFLGPDLCLEYDVLQYPEVPIYPMIPATQHGTSFGYTVGFDLLCVQEAVDLLYSTILSNQATFGVQNIWIKPGSNLAPSQLGGGLNVFESTDKPEPINLTNTPPEIFNFLKGLETLGEVISGVNSVARGQPEASLKSGSALALVASQAVQFSNGLQAAYVRMQEDSATGLLRILQKKAALPRATVIAGKDNLPYMEDFTGKDLEQLGRVIVDMSNPMSQTLSGRMQMAQDMTQLGATPDQYFQVVSTGRLDSMMKDKQSEELLIASENEALQKGRPVMAIATDMHIKHIQAHKLVLGTAQSRMRPDLVNAVNAHIQEHINALRTTDPALLNALGQAPIAVQPNGAPTPPQGQNAPQPNAPQPAPGEQMPAPEGTPPDVAAQMPQMPVPANAPGAA